MHVYKVSEIHVDAGLMQGIISIGACYRRSYSLRNRDRSWINIWNSCCVHDVL